MPEPQPAAALRACAAGLYRAEAACELLIATSWPHRADFRDRFIHAAVSISDGTTAMASIDWAAAITALAGGQLQCSGAERRLLRLAASLGDGIPVDLQDALASLDDANLGLVTTSRPSRRRPVSRNLNPAWWSQHLKIILVVRRRVYASQAQEAFLEGHVTAFEATGGVPFRQVRYDNLAPAVAKVLTGRNRTETARWLSFRAFCGFEAFYCQPGPEGAHEKGGIEGEIGRFRRRWFVPVPRAASLAELNARLAEADAAEDARHIAGRAASIGQDFAAERGLLLPLPPEPFATAAVLWPRVDRYARVSVGKCRYSVPARLIGSRVRVMLSANELRVFDGSALAAVHPRLIAAGDEHLELDHYLEILVRKPGALPGSAALAQARAAGAFTSAHEAFWAAARARHGDAAGTRALIEVLLLHRRMPAAQVIAGMTAALGAGSCSPDVVAVEARKHAAATPGPAGGPSWPAAQPRRSRAAVITLPARRDPLPPDQRPAPSVAAYDQLLTGREGGA